MDEEQQPQRSMSFSSPSRKPSRKRRPASLSLRSEEELPSIGSAMSSSPPSLESLSPSFLYTTIAAADAKSSLQQASNDSSTVLTPRGPRPTPPAGPRRTQSFPNYAEDEAKTPTSASPGGTKGGSDTVMQSAQQQSPTTSRGFLNIPNAPQSSELESRRFQSLLQVPSTSAQPSSSRLEGVQGSGERSLEDLASEWRRLSAAGSTPRQRDPIAHEFLRVWMTGAFLTADSNHTIKRTSLKKSYDLTCAAYGMSPLSVSWIGKTVRTAFPDLGSKRLGSRSASVWHYIGLKPANTWEALMLERAAEVVEAERAASAASSPKVAQGAEDQKKKKNFFVAADDDEEMDESDSSLYSDSSLSDRSESGHGYSRNDIPPAESPLQPQPHPQAQSHPLHVISPQEHLAAANYAQLARTQGILPSTAALLDGVRSIKDWPVPLGSELDALALPAWHEFEALSQRQLEAFESLDFKQFAKCTLDQYSSMSKETQWAIWGSQPLCEMLVQADQLLFEHLTQLLDVHLADPPVRTVSASLKEFAQHFSTSVGASLAGTQGERDRLPEPFVRAKVEVSRRWCECLLGIERVWSDVVELRTFYRLGGTAWLATSSPSLPIVAGTPPAISPLSFTQPQQPHHQLTHSASSSLSSTPSDFVDWDSSSTSDRDSVEQCSPLTVASEEWNNVLAAQQQHHQQQQQRQQQQQHAQSLSFAFPSNGGGGLTKTTSSADLTAASLGLETLGLGLGIGTSSSSSGNNLNLPNNNNNTL